MRKTICLCTATIILRARPRIARTRRARRRYQSTGKRTAKRSRFGRDFGIFGRTRESRTEVNRLSRPGSVVHLALLIRSSRGRAYKYDARNAPYNMFRAPNRQTPDRTTRRVRRIVVAIRGTDEQQQQHKWRTSTILRVYFSYYTLVIK